MTVLRVKTPFALSARKVFTIGTLVDASDPIVKGRESLFEPVETAAARTASVEQATAAPGEKRTRSRGK